jgi:LCP family protein required for cell wall assembly
MKKYEKEKYLYLVAGLDDAAENTDVLFTLGYDSETHITRIAQIPRDTYFNFGGGQNKINQYYASRRYAGEDKSTAMSHTAEAISKLFGTEFDGYIALSTTAFRNVVNAIGGLNLEVPDDITVTLDTDESPIVLHKGVNHIDGAMAERFVRYRSGYVMGDLGRLDAQKIFLNALFAKVTAGLTFPSLMRIAGVLQNEAITNIKLSSIASIVIDEVKSDDEKKTVYATVPGEPIQNANGLSYYVLNRKSAAELAKTFMFATKEFDVKHQLCNNDELGFVNIYNDDSYKIKEYSNYDLSNMHIK